MLQKLSYINLLMAMIYLIVYLRSGTFNSTSGILAVVIFNWLYLRSYQLENYSWKIWHYISGLWSLYFMAIIGYGTLNIILVSIETEYVSPDILTNSIISILFMILVLTHLIGYWIKKLKYR